MRLEDYNDSLLEIETGETIRVNHFDCPAGEDTRRRLYITKPEGDPNRVIGYCHNCSESGVLTIKHEPRFRNVSKQPIIKQEDKIEEPKGLEFDVDNWSTDAHGWRMRSNLSKEVCQRWQIAEDASTGRVYLPQFDSILRQGLSARSGKLIGYQLRDVRGRGPKYLTVKSRGSEGYTAIDVGPRTIEDEKVIIVEDLVSGIHIAEAYVNRVQESVQVLVNYGIKENTDALFKFAPDKRVIVWFDNDGEQVERQARLIQRTALLFGAKGSRVVGMMSDPKHYSKYELVGEISGG